MRTKRGFANRHHWQLETMERRLVPSTVGALASATEPSLYSETAGGTLLSGDGFLRTRSVSDDGRYTVFASKSPNLVAGQVDLNSLYDIFVFDRTTNSTELISHTTSSMVTAANGTSYNPTISGDGRYIVYETTATDVVPELTVPPESNPGSAENVIHYDRLTKTTTVVTRKYDSITTGSNAGVQNVNLSANGQVVIFSTGASNLIPNFPNPGNTFAYAFSILTGQLTLVSHKFGQPGVPCNGISKTYDLSADGRYIVISGGGTNMLPTSPGGGGNVYRYDLENDSVLLASRTAANPQLGGSACTRPSITNDGQFVLFQSKAIDLVAGYSGSGFQIFRYDVANDSMLLVSHADASPNTGGNGESQIPIISDNGQIVSYMSRATNLVPAFVDANGTTRWDTYVYNSITEITTLVTHRADAINVSGNGGTPGVLAISADGKYVLFASTSTDLMDGITLGHQSPFGNLFTYEPFSDKLCIVNNHEGNTSITANSFCQLGWLSNDGSTVVFSTDANDIISGFQDADGAEDVFVRDIALGNTVAASRRFGSPSDSAGGESYWYDQSDDGRYVVFTSLANNLVPGQVDRPNTQDVFLYDRVAHTTILVSRSVGTIAHAAAGESAIPVISGDGRFVAYASYATDVVDGFVNGNGDGVPGNVQYSGTDVYLFDRVTGINQLVSRQAGTTNVGGNQVSGTFNAYTDFGISINDDGRYVAYFSLATDLVPGFVDANGTFPNSSGGGDIFAFDRIAGSNRLVSHQANESAISGNFDSGAATISGDGRFVAYSSGASNLMAGMTGGGNSIFVYDQLNDVNTLVSHSAASTKAAVGNSRPAVISQDGNFVVFNSASNILVPGQSDTNNLDDVFLYNRVTGINTLVSHAFNSVSTAGDRSSHFSIAGHRTSNNVISADGRYVTYPSGASNLIEGFIDNNGQDAFSDTKVDVFVYDRVTGKNTLISHAAGNPFAGGNGDSHGGNDAVISGDGRYIAFVSTAYDVIEGFQLQTNLITSTFYNVYRYDRLTGQASMLSHSVLGPANAAGSSLGPTINMDGSVVTFWSASDILVEGDFNTFADIFSYVTTPPRVTSVQINDGSVQRSTIRSMTITLDDYVFLDFSPLSLINGQGQAVGGVQWAVEYENNTTIMTVTFSGVGTEFGSLADGKYTLSLNASKISGVGSLDGNGDGGGGDDYVFTFHRLFGDANGDGSVSASDYNAFRMSYGFANFAFDFNNDGIVSASDFNQFRLRYGVMI